jgi:hypothetical protein
MLAVAVEAREHIGGRGADRAVGARIRRVGRCVAGERKPRRICGRLRVAVAVGEANRGHRTPEPIGVLGVVERDRRVGEAEVQRGEQPCGRPQIAVTCERDGLGDLVPEVLARARAASRSSRRSHESRGGRRRHARRPGGPPPSPARPPSLRAPRRSRRQACAAARGRGPQARCARPRRRSRERSIASTEA